MYIRRQRLSRRTFVSKSVNVLVGVYRAGRRDAEPVDVSSALRFKRVLRRSRAEEGGKYEFPRPKAVFCLLISPLRLCYQKASAPEAPPGLCGGGFRRKWPRHLASEPREGTKPRGAGRQAISGLISPVIEPTPHPAPQPPTTSMVQSRVDVYGSLPAVRRQDRVQLAVKSFCSALSRLFAAFRYDLRC